MVCDFILENRWNLPPHFSSAFPKIRSLVNNEIIPISPQNDELVWKETTNGQLSLKDTYIFKANSFQELHWAKSIWSLYIPPSKSLLVWRFMHDKILVDEKLKERGLLIPSMCSSCRHQEESTFHLFFTCAFATHLWRWFASVLNLSLSFPTVDDLWKDCDKGWSPQCKLTIQATIIYILNAIWCSRNNARFNNKNTHRKFAVSQIISSVSLSANLSRLSASSSITEFLIMKFLNVSIHPPRSLTVKEVIWHPPI